MTENNFYILSHNVNYVNFKNGKIDYPTATRYKYPLKSME